MTRLPHILLTTLVIGIIFSVQCLYIDETSLTLSNYYVNGNAVQGSSAIQLTADESSQKARVLYTIPQDIASGFSVTIQFSISSGGGAAAGVGESFGLVVTGDSYNFKNAQETDGGSWNLAYTTNLVAIGLDMAFGRVYLCQANNSFAFPVPPSPECLTQFLAAPGAGSHILQIEYQPSTNGSVWIIVIDGAQKLFNTDPLPIEPVTANEYYFGWSASTGGNYYSSMSFTGWSANITEPCMNNNGGCSADATCSSIGSAVNCTCNEGYQGNGITCTIIPPVAPETPIAPPIEPPVEPPVDSPVDQQVERPVAPPTNSIDSTPQSPGPEVLVPAIVIPVVGVAAALFFGIFFGRRAQKKKKENQDDSSDDVESSGGAVALTSASNATGIAPSNYATVPAMDRASGQYNSIPVVEDSSGSDSSEVNTVTTINPTGINATDIDKRMHIPYKSLVFTKEIGAGSYGKVFLGEWRGAEVAIKVNNTVTDMDGFLAEAKLTLGIAPHPNLVQTFGISLDGAYPCIVLEFCGGGSLDKLAFGEASASISDAKRKEFALKIAYGLIHLHNNNIVHRDLAARNILLSTEGQPKVSDFGMSRVIQDEEAKGKTKTNVGPLRWMSPESLKDKSYSVKSDVWSYGILVWEIVAGKEPHSEEDQLFVGVKIRDEAFHPTIPDNCDPVLREVMEMCWKKDPAERPTMEEIAQYLRKH